MANTKSSFPSPRLFRARAPIFVALMAGWIAVTPVRADPPPAPPNAGVVLGPNGKRTRGGFTYDPEAPLDAVVQSTSAATTSPNSVLTYNVTFTGSKGQKVTAIFITPAGAKSAPAVVLLHGLLGNKEQVEPVGFFLAGKGYASLTIDAAGHGNRELIDGKPIPKLNLEEMHTLFAETIADLGKAVDFLQSRPEVDPKRIGYLGVSMGAIDGVVFMSDDKRIKAASFWSGGGDFGRLLTTTDIPFVKAYRQTPDGAAVTADIIEKTMADVDPIFAVSGIAPRPVLFINGDKDTTVPPACTDEMINAAGDPKTRLTLAGSHVPNALTMISKSLEFFDKNLK